MSMLTVRGQLAIAAISALAALPCSPARAAEGDCPDEFAAACPRWEVIETKIPPGSCDGFPPQFQVRDIDDRGVVVGSLRCGFPSSRFAAIWRPGQPIVKMEMPPGTVESEAVGIDAKGRIAGDLLMPGPEGDLAFFGWILDGDNLTLIPVPDGFIEIRVEGMALDGSIAGNLYGGQHSCVFRWSDGEFELLPTPGEGLGPIVRAMSDDGTIYGRLSNVFGPLTAAPLLIVGDEWRVLPMPEGAIWGEVQDAETATLATGRVAFREGVGATAIWSGEETNIIFGDLDGPAGLRPSSIDFDGVIHAGDITADGVRVNRMLVDSQIVSSLQRLTTGLPANAEPATWFTRGQLAVGQSVSVDPDNLVMWRAVRVAGTPGDIDCDGVTGFSDLLRLVSAWSCEKEARADLNQDGVVGSSDLTILLNAWTGPPGR